MSLSPAVEPKLEELKGKIRHLQQVKRTLEEDLREAQCLRDALQEEQDALCTAVHQLEITYKEKEESCKVLQYKCEELEFDLKREQQLSSETEDLVQQYTFQIQEMKLKHRKLRMKFEGELQQLMAQHKHLYSVYSPEQLPGEIERLQKVTAQLLKAEELRLSQLNSLEEELKRVANGQQPVGALQTQRRPTFSRPLFLTLLKAECSFMDSSSPSKSKPRRSCSR